MIKKVYIDGLFMALSYEAKKIFIKKMILILSLRRDKKKREL